MSRRKYQRRRYSRRRSRTAATTKFVLFDWWAKPIAYVTKATVLTVGGTTKGVLRPWSK